MSELIERARTFATSAHQRIDQRRKYNDQPYQVHLERVARLVSSVTHDEEMIAAAWLHDVVEDTPATMEDVESEFGAPVAGLVEALTDVSRPSDGNRAVRKEIDRRHTAHASPRAKTIKLADLIDNCEDIAHHDPRFARIYLQEMEALLAVLGEGEPELMRQARALHDSTQEKLRALQRTVPPPASASLAALIPHLDNPQIVRLFRETFSASDIVEPLLSFDDDKAQSAVARVMQSRHLNIAGIRVDGTVQGYLRLTDMAAGDSAPSGQLMQHISADQVLDGSAPLTDVFGILTRHEHCFVSMFDTIVGVITRNAVNKPVVRMWLFGAITLYEMGLVQFIERCFPGNTWEALLAPARLTKAWELQKERERRNLHSNLIDCLQFSDKMQILLEDQAALEALGIKSKRTAKLLTKELESLRNHLAHSQDIATHDWVQIIRITQRLSELGPQ